MANCVEVSKCFDGNVLGLKQIAMGSSPSNARFGITYNIDEKSHQAEMCLVTSWDE